jgi:hypothetical protein
MAKGKGKATKRKAKRVRIQTPKATRDDASYEEEDEDGICRCICGDNNFTAKRPWIQCTACNVWQHNDCMDVSVFDDELGDHYWCEDCDPDSHAVLLAAAARGEKPWEVRCERRLKIKVQFEQSIRTVLKQVEWLWELYEPQPSAVAGHDDIVPRKRAAPSFYIGAVQAAMEIPFENLPMRSLRDLAQQVGSGNGRQSVMYMLWKKAAAEFDVSDVRLLGVLSELFEWVEKGKFYSDKPAGGAVAQRSARVRGDS